MLDFIRISTKMTKNGLEVYPKFIVKKSSDLMIRGGDFYAVWVEELGLWSTDEQYAIDLIDKELDIYSKGLEKEYGPGLRVMYLWDSESGMVDRWHKYCQQQLRDNYTPLDETLVFSNDPINKKLYASKRLPYPLEEGGIDAWSKLLSTLYSEEERRKIEWAIGSIVTGDSKEIQKFLVLYGAQGSGKSTIINIVEKLFEGYCASFDAKALGSTNNSFALEAFKNNPLVAIQHDGDLSKIEDNTRLNSLVSHEVMTVNEKFKSQYSNRFKCFLFMGTNEPVKITNGKSGLLRRLIDVTPTGNKLSPSEYRKTVKLIDFELGAIAYHCKEVYLSDPGYYDDYIPVTMLGASNEFYNFVVDSYHVFKKDNGATLNAAWEMYKNYCEDAKVPYPFSKRIFKEELKNYFRDYSERFDMADGSIAKCYYSNFRTDIFDREMGHEKKKPEPKKLTSWLEMTEPVGKSPLDEFLAEYPAQYGNSEEKPIKGWDYVETKLKDIDTSKLHYSLGPENLITVDFDLKDENGNKSFERNFEAASKWPPTYAELSKGGAGIHLEYIYTGDSKELSRVYDEDIEIKIFTGKASLRRRLSKCNNLPIATISSGLPLKEVKKVISKDVIMTEKSIRSMIKRNIEKEFHPGTKPSIDFIKKILDDAYESGIGYDVSDMENAVTAFAAQSTHQADYCLKLVNDMKFKSEEPSLAVNSKSETMVFYDIEVFPNLFIVCWKIAGEGNPIVRMINPRPSDIEDLIRFRLVGYNNRRYDNHLIYAAMMGYDNEALYNLSQKIINSEKGDRNNGMFGEAYNLSYTDIYDFASAGNKMSLKKLEIQMGFHHQELGLPWDQPVPKELWTKVAEYCDNDVLATEAAFYYLSADWTARQILADLAGMTVNDTTNTLSTKIIFGNNRKPQSEFQYRNLADPILELDPEVEEFLREACPGMMAHMHGDAHSLLPYFPGYEFKMGKSYYRGEEVGEGGYVYAEPGMYGNVALLDVSSMHPHSAIAECLFGVKYTKAFRDIVEGRVSIKHEAWEEVNHMLDGKLTPYIQKVIDGEMTSKDLANALKTAINSVYGLTSAKFENAFRDPRNKDNIVAKRGALFMVDLKHEVQKRGFTVVHIKTDSIKIADATPEIIQFVMDFGERYGYSFEHEATYERICLVNDAVYIARYLDKDGKPGDWTATGKQFAVPYVFKTLFSGEPIELDDLADTFSVRSALYLDMNENLPNVEQLEKELSKLQDKYKKGKLSDTTFEPESMRLVEEIAKGHDYHFIGKVGRFCPVKPGFGGGYLLRSQGDKYYSATGASGYRWLEAETMLTESNAKYIDRSYYNALVDGAVETISQYGDFEWFVSDDPYVPAVKPDFMNIPDGYDEDEGVPFDEFVA